MSGRLGELFLQSPSEIYKNHYANYTSNSCKSVSERESVPQENEHAYKQTVNSEETASDEEARRPLPEMREQGDTASSHPILGKRKVDESTGSCELAEWVPLVGRPGCYCRIADSQAAGTCSVQQPGTGG